MTNKNRFRVFLRSTSGVNSTTKQSQINLPPKIYKKMGWSLNENLKLDIIKMGMEMKLLITRED